MTFQLAERLYYKNTDTYYWAQITVFFSTKELVRTDYPPKMLTRSTTWFKIFQFEFVLVYSKYSMISVNLLSTGQASSTSNALYAELQ